MKFSEKIIELRKKGGLTQDDIAYQFNVTRQTVANWESGKIVPEMDKLVEISKFFNVSVDELINGQEMNYNENFIDEKVTQKNGTKRKVIIIIVVALLIIMLSKTFISTIFDTINNTFESVNGQIEDVNEQKSNIFSIFNQASNIINQVFQELDKVNNDKNDIQEGMNKVQDIIGKGQNEIGVKSFNGTFELYEGIIKGVQVKSLLSEVLTNNRKETRKITVIYENQDITDEEKIKNIVTKIDSFDDYDSYFKYDEDGYVYEVNISKL